MISLSVPNISGSEFRHVKECLKSGWVSSAGPLVKKFEEAVCKHVRARHAVACINGTAGLFVALKLCGVRPGDEVIVPTLTFVAPVNIVRYLGAEPVFMDCDDFMNLDPEKVREFCKKECTMTNSGLRNKKTGRIIRAAVPVHIFGNPCDMAQMVEISRRYNFKLVEDATESIGAYYTAGACHGKFTATIGDCGVYSFNGNKIMTTGSGGMIITNDKRLADKARYLVNQAKDDTVRSIHNEVGYNLRLTNLQSSLGLAQLARLKDFIRVKKDNYESYKKELQDIAGINILGIPEGTAPNYWFYSLVIEKRKFGVDRDGLMDRLQARGIETRPIWYLNHLQRPYRRNQTYKIEKAPRFWEKVLNLPCSTNLKIKQIKYITSVIRTFGQE